MLTPARSLLSSSFSHAVLSLLLHVPAASWVCERALLRATADLCHSTTVPSATGTACPSGIQLVHQPQTLNNAVKFPACTGSESKSRQGEALGQLSTLQQVSWFRFRSLTDGQIFSILLTALCNFIPNAATRCSAQLQVQHMTCNTGVLKLTL